MTTTTKTHTLTNQPSNAPAFADALNLLRKHNDRMSVNGREVDAATTLSSVATSFGTGSVSVRVKARRGNGFAQVWVKPGQSVEVAVGPR